jgi:hypothetical protein
MLSDVVYRFANFAKFRCLRLYNFVTLQYYQRSNYVRRNQINKTSVAVGTNSGADGDFKSATLPPVPPYGS